MVGTYVDGRVVLLFANSIRVLNLGTSVCALWSGSSSPGLGGTGQYDVDMEQIRMNTWDLRQGKGRERWAGNALAEAPGR